MRKYIVIGIDEAGRGPLAGPIAVAAIKISFKISSKTNMPYKNDRWYLANLKIMEIKRDWCLKNIRDSKKLSAKQRKEWLEILKKNFEYRVAMVEPQIIDKIGIQKATKLAVSRVLRKFRKKLARRSLGGGGPDLVILDGSLFAPKHYNQKTIIKGDEKVPLIAAASIIAKVSRDRKMLRLHKKFPCYCFNKHKGYATKLHYKMIKKYGFCPAHRRSFC